MRTAELRMKEETAVAEKRGVEKGREEEQRKAIKNTYKLFKSLSPNSTVDEVLQWIKANTDVSLSDEEIKAILSENN